MTSIKKFFRLALANPGKSFLALAGVVIITVGIINLISNEEKVKEHPTANINKPPDDINQDLPEPPDDITSIDPTNTNKDQVKPEPDPYDYDPETKARIIEQLNTMPAFQKLPYSGKTIAADFTDGLPDGRILIQIVYVGSKQDAVNEWKSFLKQNKDTGIGYVVVYKKG